MKHNFKIVTRSDKIYHKKLENHRYIMQGPVLNDISISVLKAVEVTGIRLMRNSDE